jgi:hypothetical protein
MTLWSTASPEVYRGIEIEVVYCYLGKAIRNEKADETPEWRYSLPDASYWMYKFATPEEAFLKARERVDLRLKEGTLVRSSQASLNPDTAMPVPDITPGNQ